MLTLLTKLLAAALLLAALAGAFLLYGRSERSAGHSEQLLIMHTAEINGNRTLTR